VLETIAASGADMDYAHMVSLPVDEDGMDVPVVLVRDRNARRVEAALDLVWDHKLANVLLEVVPPSVENGNREDLELFQRA
jgi:hypothetical protein